MNKRKAFGLALLCGTALFTVGSVAISAEVQSLRGMQEIEAESNPAVIQHWQEDKEPIERDYVQQPPLVPHAIEGYKVNLKFNKCLTCHSWANYKEARATKISQTHFEDRDGDVLASVSARRYFCTQCHVPQVDAKPLVENEFQPVTAITGQ